jgi:hypothetical protein
MSDATLGQKISWFLYQKGLSGVAKPDFLNMARFPDPQWFKVADTLIKDNNVGGRELTLDYLLEQKNFRPNPKRSQILRMTAFFLSKGLLDERRRVVKYIDDNSALFSSKDDLLFGPLMTAQRDSDTVIAVTAESAVRKIKGEEPAPQRGPA